MEYGLFRYYQEMQKEGAILYFNGPVSQGIVESIAESMRDKMRAEEAGMGSVQCVFSILVEQMQNIVRYSSERHVSQGVGEGEMAYGQIVVGRESDGCFFVACGNRIRVADECELVGHIETVRGMSKAELKAYYRERRKSPSPLSVKGAGLGFVEMARKSARPMDFNIVPLDCETSFFSMKVVAQ